MAGEQEFNAALDALAARVQLAGRKLAMEAALLVEAEAKRVASSGIFAHPTGTTKRSIHSEPMTGDVNAYKAQVGPSTVYSRRLELGFDGPDSLGRVFHQRPRPFMRPGRQNALPKVLGLARRRFAAAIKG